MAKIDITKIENFNDMDAEALRKFIQGYEYEDNAAELTKLKTETQKLIKAKDDATSEASNYKKQLREKLSEQERIEAERLDELEKLKNENAEFKKTALLNEYKASALSMGYSEALALKRAEAMVNNDFTALTVVDKEFLAEYEKTVKSNAIKSTPKPAVGGNPNDDKVVTKQQFDLMGYSERVKLATENPELYAELSK